MTSKSIDLVLSSMAKIRLARHLPFGAEDDLSGEREVLTSFSSNKLIWFLHASGSVLIPCRVGMNPRHITDLLYSDDPLMRFYCIDTSTGNVEGVSKDTAEKEIVSMPCELSALDSPESLVKKVNAALVQGCRKNVWGVYQAPRHPTDMSWQGWLDFFSKSSNHPMVTFMERAIRLNCCRMAA